jgi:hypothetical protein
MGTMSGGIEMKVVELHGRGGECSRGGGKVVEVLGC